MPNVIHLFQSPSLLKFGVCWALPVDGSNMNTPLLGQPFCNQIITDSLVKKGLAQITRPDFKTNL